MIRIIEYLFPDYKRLFKNSYRNDNQAVVSIMIEDELFFLTIYYDIMPENFIESLYSQLGKYFSKSLNIKFTNDTTVDLVDREQEEFILSQKNKIIHLNIPLDFSIYLSKMLNFINSAPSDHFLGLHQELYRFYPTILPINIWLSIPDKDLANLFNAMLAKNIASIKMFAIFFKIVPIKNPYIFFSKRIATELQYEIDCLCEKESPELLTSIYYIIEHNIISDSSIKSIPGLSELNNLIDYYMRFFLKESLPNINLEKFESLIYCSSDAFIYDNPYKSMLSFLKFSLKKNIEIIEKYFSKKSYHQIIEDLKCPDIEIIDSIDFLKYLSKLEYKYNGYCLEFLIKEYMKSPRDWEFLARECSLYDVLLAIESLEKRSISSLGGIVKTVYEAYKEKIIIMPEMKNKTVSDSRNKIGRTIIYLKLLQLL